MTENGKPGIDFLKWWLIVVTIISVASLVTAFFFYSPNSYDRDFEEITIAIVFFTVFMWISYYKDMDYPDARGDLFVASLLPFFCSCVIFVVIFRELYQP